MFCNLVVGKALSPTRVFPIFENKNDETDHVFFFVLAARQLRGKLRSITIMKLFPSSYVFVPYFPFEFLYDNIFICFFCC